MAGMTILTISEQQLAKMLDDAATRAANRVAASLAPRMTRQEVAAYFRVHERTIARNAHLYPRPGPDGTWSRGEIIAAPQNRPTDGPKPA